MKSRGDYRSPSGKQSLPPRFLEWIVIFAVFALIAFVTASWIDMSWKDRALIFLINFVTKSLFVAIAPFSAIALAAIFKMF
jgi:hypothetical protein